MYKQDVTIGLDIGTTKICTVVADRDDSGRPEIVGVGMSVSSGIRKGVVVDIDSATASIEDSVEKAQRMSGAEIASAYVGVTGQHITSQNSTGVVAVAQPDHEISEADVVRVVEAAKSIPLPPDREIIHAVPRGFSIDGQGGVSSPVGMAGSRLEVETHIVTGTTTFLTNVEKCVEKAGLRIDAMVLEPLATGEACLTAAEKDLGVVLIDIGGGTTDVGVFVNGSIFYSAVLPLGGNHVTYDVAVGLRTSQEEAERLKIEKGCAVVELTPEDGTVAFTGIGGQERRELPQRVLAEIIEPRMQEICLLARKEVEKSGYQDLLAAGCVLTGGGALVQGAPDCAQSVMSMPARLGYPDRVLGLSDAVSSPIYSTAVGLVQYGMSHDRSGGRAGRWAGQSLWDRVVSFFRRQF
jgi:cell division protein FtsA